MLLLCQGAASSFPPPPPRPPRHPHLQPSHKFLTFTTQFLSPLLPGLLETWPTEGVACCPCCLVEALGMSSLFRTPTPTPAGGAMNSPSVWLSFGSSVLVVFLMLCLGKLTGEAEGTDSWKKQNKAKRQEWGWSLYGPGNPIQSLGSSKTLSLGTSQDNLIPWAKGSNRIMTFTSHVIICRDGTYNSIPVENCGNFAGRYYLLS